MKVLETRTRPDGIKRRRYQAEDGTTMTTYELPATVVRGIGWTAIERRIALYNRGEEQRRKWDEVRGAICRYMSQGWKPTAVAHELGVTENHVRRTWKKTKES